MKSLSRAKSCYPKILLLIPLVMQILITIFVLNWNKSVICKESLFKVIVDYFKEDFFFWNTLMSNITGRSDMQFL